MPLLEVMERKCGRKLWLWTGTGILKTHTVSVSVNFEGTSKLNLLTSSCCSIVIAQTAVEK